MAQKIDRVEKLYLQRFSAVGDGMWLELCKGDAAGGLVDGEPYPIAFVRADAGAKLRFVFLTAAGDVSVPLAELERALEVARDVVFAEEDFDLMLQGGDKE